MNTMINLAVRFSGLGWVWEKTDGAKTYIAAGIAILTGLSGVLSEVLPPLGAHDAGALLSVLKHLPQDSSWMMLVGGLGTLGLGHKASKMAQDEVPVAPPAATSPNPQTPV